ncbi:MAG TPA: TIGR01777 family oxidoreductase [Candidatus Acidoferrales bacterium]|nr:TIGR01777 family oxidoreductase [Candidatus Acidoferrales bacterium]
MNELRILISGASGLVGAAATIALRADGHEVGHLVRSRGSLSTGDVRWDPAAGTADQEAMEGASAIVHLAGAGIGDSRWAEARKKILCSSRVDSTRILVDAISKLRQKPRVLLAASATGFYGNRGDELLAESSAAGSGFLAVLARAWEGESLRAESLGVRTVLLRFGMILSAQGGALPKVITPFKFGVGGRLGSGNQWMSWIALDDVIGVIRAALADEAFSGPVNVVAPNPLRNVDFTRALARALHRPAILPAPAFALRLALGREMADELLLSSQRVQPQKLIAAGYAFRFPELDPALKTILTQRDA